MKSDRANYGLDAPIVVRNLLIVGALGLLSLITLLCGVWNAHQQFAQLGFPLIYAGISCGAMGLWMLYDSAIGKVRERETYLDMLKWTGNEHVLDIGCGRGLFLIGAAKRLTTGRAVGIDLWQKEDLSGNTPAAPIENARIENVADRVEVQTGDARHLPFPDASFDVVVSSMALHNIYNAGERQTAVREIARVLRPGGQLLIVDVRHTNQYTRVLRDAGIGDVRNHMGVWSYFIAIVTFGSVRGGEVVRSRQ